MQIIHSAALHFHASLALCNPLTPLEGKPIKKHKATLITCSTLKIHSVIVTCQTITTWHAICEYFAPQSVFLFVATAPHRTTLQLSAYAYMYILGVYFNLQGKYYRNKSYTFKHAFGNFCPARFVQQLHRSHASLKGVIIAWEGLNFSFPCFVIKQLLSFNA